MLKALIPVDGSNNALRAVRHVINLIKRREPMEVHLLNVQEAVDAWEVRRFLKSDEIRRFQMKRSEQQFQAAKALFDKARISYQAHVKIGDVAQTIYRFALGHRCDKIIMGTRGMGSVRNLLLGSVATKVIHLSKVPVTLVK